MTDKENKNVLEIKAQLKNCFERLLILEEERREIVESAKDEDELSASIIHKMENSEKKYVSLLEEIESLKKLVENEKK